MDRVNDTLNDILADLDVTIARLKRAGAQGEPDATSERKYFEAQRRHYAKAQYHHLAGVRPRSSGRAWLIPSGTRPGLVHRVALVEGIHLCDCEASNNGRSCWHTRLIEAYERAADETDRFDDGLETADLCGGSFDPDDDAAYAAMLAAA